VKCKGGDVVGQQKILYCASTASHLCNFHLPYMKGLQAMGYHVTACVNESCDLPFTDEVKVIPFHKRISSIENIKNIFRVYRFLKQEKYTAISVHSTLAGVVVRAAVRLLPKAKRPKVYYTCHGYLFSNHDSVGKWKYLLPEKICAKVTDVLMVMNSEDAELAEQYKLYNKKKGKLFSIPGMGVDFSKFDIPQSKAELRKQYNIADDKVLYVFAGEFSERKNQKMLINAFARVAQQMPNAMLILAGEGTLLGDCKQLVTALGLQDQIIFPGYVTNMPMLYRIGDVCVSASKIEGLPFNIMEAMYCQLPCIVSDIKGHRDLITNVQTGYVYLNETELSSCLLQLYNNNRMRMQLGQIAKVNVEKYRLNYVYNDIMKIYDLVK